MSVTMRRQGGIQMQAQWFNKDNRQTKGKSTETKQT